VYRILVSESSGMTKRGGPSNDEAAGDVAFFEGPRAGPVNLRAAAGELNIRGKSFRNFPARSAASLEKGCCCISQPIIEARRVLTESASRISQAVLAVSNFS
jgi:hypothetical protein